MYTNYDYEDEQQSMEEKMNQFFGPFSSEIRNRLMSKNLVKPESLYDVFYPSVKKDLLSKNENHFNVNLDEFSENIRNQQLAKAVEKTFSLEEQSEDFRKSLLARENLHKSTTESFDLFETKRKDLLSKNVSSTADLFVDSTSYRNTNVAKNAVNPNLEKKTNENQDEYRNENLAHNSSKEQDLLGNSEQFRKEELSKNNLHETDLEEKSKAFRDGEIALNKTKESDLEIDSETFRREALSKNNSHESDLEVDSESFKKENLAKNVTKETDLEVDSEQFKKENLAKNVSKETDLEMDSTRFRNEELSKNKQQGTDDLADDSESFRNNQLANNVPKDSSLEDDSNSFRSNQLANNVTKKSDLEDDSSAFRNSDLAYNNSKTTDLEADSNEFRKENISNNTPKQTDLLIDSEGYKKNNVSNNISKETDLEVDSISYRKNEMSLNVPSTSDLESGSVTYRNKELSLNVPSTSDLEDASVSYRENVLAENVSSSSDLEEDSVPYRESVLAENVPSDSDLEKDSIPYRDTVLAENVPNNSDLETDSVTFRNDVLAENVPGTSNLEEDSVQFRSDLVAENVPSTSDLETDSVTYRDDLVAENVLGTSDLETDSVTYRDDLIAENVPNNSDLEDDSITYRDDLIAENVPNNSDLEDDSVSYRNDELAHNVPNTSDLETDSTQYRNNELVTNVPSKQTIDSHFDQFGTVSSGEDERIKNLNKNTGFGQLGFNVLGPGGTSVYVGVSGVWTQGLLFRNLLTMRNKYVSGGITGVSSKYYTESYVAGYGEGGMLLQNTLNVPRQSDIIASKALPMNPAEFINTTNTVDAARYYIPYTEVTSPIKRSLQTAYVFALTQKLSLNYYSVYGSSKTTKIKINYDLDNDNKFGYVTSEEQSLPEDNINNLIRQYLKYSNSFALNDKGSLKSTNTDNNVAAILAKIQNMSLGNGLTVGTNPKATKTINDLMTSYEEAFKLKAPKSLTSPSESYFTQDVETQFDATYNSDENINDPNAQKIIAAKQFAGNPVHEEGFDGITAKKGVRYVLRKISNSDIDFKTNYQDIQGKVNAPSKTFIIGKTKIGGNQAVKNAYQKYTVENPYAPQNAGKLIFYFKNYSNGQQMYFPPYINSFQNSDSANWNTTNFLGRQEAIYTYNNSSRDGSISFFVLTDFAESVVIGRKQDEDMKLIEKPIGVNFQKTSTTFAVQAREAKRASLVKELQEKQNKLTEEFNKSTSQQIVTLKTTESGTTQAEIDKKVNDKTQDGYATYSKEMQDIQALINKENAAAEDEISSLSANYSESSIKYKNVYELNVTSKDRVDGYIETKVGDTIARIDEMIKNLAFQPAFFSGSKADFKNRMEFLSKMTRPANNTVDRVYNDTKMVWEGSGGFSFTRPPVCHMRLGDWIDHDIIVNSVSYDYSDAPWTTDLNIGGKVQPMWANVTINFNIVGPAGGRGVPLTSTDVEGFYGTKTIRG